MSHVICKKHYRQADLQNFTVPFPVAGSKLLHALAEQGTSYHLPRSEWFFDYPPEEKTVCGSGELVQGAIDAACHLLDQLGMAENQAVVVWPSALHILTPGEWTLPPLVDVPSFTGWLRQDSQRLFYCSLAVNASANLEDDLILREGFCAIMSSDVSVRVSAEDNKPGALLIYEYGVNLIPDSPADLTTEADSGIVEGQAA